MCLIPRDSGGASKLTPSLTADGAGIPRGAKQNWNLFWGIGN